MNEPDPNAETEIHPPTESEESTTLQQALVKANVKLDTAFHEPVDAYCRSLWEWNQHLNLTRHDSYDKFVTRDLIDTIEVGGLIPIGQHVLDVGTGGGVPGVVLSLIRPDLKVTVCDSVTKKAKAVNEMVAQLEIPVTVVHARAEELLEMSSFDTLTARAVGSLLRILTWFEGSWSSIGQLLLIKGPKWVEERGEARHHGKMNGLELRKVAEYPIPGCDWNSVILNITNKSKT